MKVFITGATGFIGTAVVRELLDNGHQVVGLARTDKGAAALKTAGAGAHRGTLEDLASLRSAAAAADGVIHLAFMHDLAHASISTRLGIMFKGSPRGIVSRFMAATVGADRRAIETLSAALTGHGRAIVVTAPTMALTPGQIATEEDAFDINTPGGPRGQSEREALTKTAHGLRASMVRLPPVVHSEGDRTGFVPALIAGARKSGISAYVGDGHNRWPAVHRLDAARLFRLALENGEAGASYHGVAEVGVPFLDIANLIGQRLKVPVAAKSPKEATSIYSWIANFMTVDNPVSSTLTQARLGWQPVQPGLIADLEAGHYFNNKM